MRFLYLALMPAVFAAPAAAQPAQSRPTVELEAVSDAPPAASQHPQQLRYNPDASDRMTIGVQLSGQGPYNFLVDTGADRTVVSRNLAGQLKLARKDGAILHSITGAKPVSTTSIDSLRFSSKTVRNVRAAVLEARDIGADGILGIDSLRSERITFDFKKGSMTIVPSETHQQRLEKDEVVVRGKLRSGRLVLTKASARRQRINVVVDTGADVSIGNEALRRVLRRTGLLRPLGLVQMQSVTGELLSGDMVVLDRLEVGGVTIENLNIIFADAHTFKTLKLEETPSLLMGMNVLKAFERVSIDFANKKFRVLLPEHSGLKGMMLASRGTKKVGELRNY